MATKLTFEAKMENVDQVLKQLNDLAKSLETVAGAAGGGTSSSANQLKELSKQINELSSAQGGLSGFLRSFTEIGKSINNAFGDAQIRQIQRFRQEMGVLSQDIELRKDKLSRAEALSSSPAVDAFKLKQASEIAAAQDALQAARLQNIIQTPFIKTGMGNVSLGGLGGAAKAAMIGGAVLNSAMDMSIEAPMRNQLAERRANWKAYEEAEHGDITRYMLRDMNMGTAQGIRNGNFDETMRMGMGLVGANIGAAASALNPFGGNFFQYKAVTPGEMYEKELMRREGMDKEQIAPVMGGYGTLIQQRNQVGADTIRNLGEDVADAVFRGIAANQGIPQAIAAPYANIAARMGLTPNGDVLAQIRRSNLGGDAAAGVFREQGRFGADAARRAQVSIQQAMGNRRNAETFGQTMEFAAQQQAQGALGMSLGEGGANIANVFKTFENRPDVDVSTALRISGAAVNKVNEQSKNPMTMIGWQDMRTLANLGITNPIEQYMYTQMGLDKASTREAIARSGHKPIADVEKELSASRKAGYDYTTNILGGGNAQVGAFISSGGNIQMTPEAMREATVGMGRGLGDGSGPLDEYRLKSEKTIEAGQAEKEAATIKSMEDVIEKTGSKAAQAVYDAIGKSFTTLGNELKTLASQTVTERQDDRVRQGLATEAFGGSKDRHLRELKKPFQQ